MTIPESAKQFIADAGRRLWQQGLTTAADGNISLRLEGDTVLATPSGVSKGFLRPDDMLLTDMDGKVLEGRGQPSSELKMHLAIYKVRPDVRAIVHAHPPTATGFAAAGIALDTPLIAEAVVMLGKVPVAPYAAPGTQAVADNVAALAREHDCILMANHGAVTCGKTPEQALLRMETLEHFAKVTLTARLLGKTAALKPEDVEYLLKQRQNAG